MVILLGACARSFYMAESEESSYTATLAAVAGWEGSPIRVIVGPRVNYRRSIQRDDIGHPYGLTNDIDYSDGIAMEVVNETDSPVQIDWARSSFVEVSGAVRQILACAPLACDQKEPQPRTVIPGRGRVSKVVYPQNAVESVGGEQHFHIYLPTDVPNLESTQVTLVLAVVQGGALSTYPEPIAVHVTGSTSIKKWGTEWPTLLAACDPMVGCASGLACQETIEFRCVPIP